MMDFTHTLTEHTHTHNILSVRHVLGEWAPLRDRVSAHSQLEGATDFKSAKGRKKAEQLIGLLTRRYPREFIKT